MMNEIQFWATVTSPIIAVIGIFVALYISRNSSKDILKLIESNKIDSNNQIRTIRAASTNEIRQLRMLIHTLLIVVVHYLESENIDVKNESHKLTKTLNELLIRFKKIKMWKIEDSSTIDDINSHFSEMRELESSMLSLIEQFKKTNDSSVSISRTLEKLRKPIDDFYESRYE